MISHLRKKVKRALIIEAAAKVFARRGFFGTVMADIAAGAGIGKGTIYEYFDSKEDLFFAVFEWYVQKIETEARVSISGLSGPASERLQSLSDSLMNAWGEMRELFSLVMEFWSASASSLMRERFKKAFRQVYRDFRLIVSNLILEGMQRGEFRAEVDADSVAAALVGTWDALLLQAWFEDSFDPVTTAGEFMSVLTRGLAVNLPANGEDK